jgi:hypothetical protein
MTPLIDRQLVDRAVEVYVDWREACIWVNDAYLVWSRQRGSDADVTFGGYTAALDREERIAAHYARVVDWVSDVVGRADAYLDPHPAGATEASGG